MTANIRSPQTVRRVAVAALAAAVAGLATGCAVPPAGGSAGIPSTPVGEQTTWVLEQLNGPELESDERIADHFVPELLEDVPLDDIVATLDGLRLEQPWTVTEYDGTETEAEVEIDSDAATFELQLSVAGDGRLNGMVFGEPTAELPPSTSWDELADRLEELPYETSLTVTEQDADTPLFSSGTQDAVPVGSIFKLGVLGAVVQAVDDGRLAWETELVIDDEVRSLPTGELQDLPDGATVTVHEAALKMISISDNTAADLLMREVGRDAVLQAFADLGHDDPQRNTPLLSTREFFWIGWGDPGLRERWADASAAEREALLQQVPAGLPDPETLDWSVPAWRSDVDWFASPSDITDMHLALQELARTDAGAPIREILSENPGGDFDGQWEYVGFKGGSASGVLAGSWHLERDGHPPIVIVLTARSDDPEELADAEQLFWFAQDAAQLVANQ